MTKEDKEEAARLVQQGVDKSAAARSAAAQEKVAAFVADRASQPEIDAEFDKLTEQISGGRPAAGELFWRRLCGLVCLCNCAICLLAAIYSPTVLMLFCYLWGCIPAKTGDVVAIPKDYIAWGVAVVILVDKQYPGRRNPKAFFPIRWHQRKTLTFNGGTFACDSINDEEEHDDEYRVSFIPASNEDVLMPGAMYDEERDWLGVYKNESAGQKGNSVIKFPLMIKDERGRYRKTVVAIKCRRRQFVMAYLLSGMLSALSWLPAFVRDFEVLKERAEDPVTIGVQITGHT